MAFPCIGHKTVCLRMFSAPAKHLSCRRKPSGRDPTVSYAFQSMPLSIPPEGFHHEGVWRCRRGRVLAAPAKKQKKGGKAAKQQAGALAELRSTQQSAKVDAVWAALRGGSAAAAATKLPGSSDAAAAPGDAAGPSATAAGGDAAAGGGEAAAEGGQGASGAAAPPQRKASFSVASLCREVKKPSKHGDDRVRLVAPQLRKDCRESGDLWCSGACLDA